MPTLRQRKLVFATLLAVIIVSIAYSIYESHDWPVPEDARQMKNPIPSSVGALAAAHSIYLDKCANCHGDTGKGDGPDAASHYPSPTNFADATRMNSATDGELFYRITNGKRPMPAFKKRLTDEQRWQLVLLIRTFVNIDTPAHLPR
jgi:mono/diheme cytochrome c family protein